MQLPYMGPAVTISLPLMLLLDAANLQGIQIVSTGRLRQEPLLLTWPDTIPSTTSEVLSISGPQPEPAPAPRAQPAGVTPTTPSFDRCAATHTLSPT